MEVLIEESIRLLGYAMLRVVTWGTYKGGTNEDRLREGAFGLVLIVAVTFVVYTIAA